ncbi:pyridoxal phosphate-dependent aminotransferase [bacterium]|nr:pyridoxal phosphate-dependent aminotransferase [bacterium]
MRCNIVHEGADKLTYEIREIVEVAKNLEAMGVEITWENIGDPIHKGEQLPEWIKQIVQDLVSRNKTYGYVASKGIPETRRFLAERVNRRNGCRITEEDIIFYNGLGDAVAKIYGFMNRKARVIVPSPAYPTHSTGEAAHAGSDNLTFDLDPGNGWMPDPDELEKKVRSNEAIAGILLINPDNPTGTVYPVPVLQAIVRIAEKYNLFVICDEIYTNILYNGASTARLSELIGHVPGMALRGISKEYPWPGSRCGWIEVYNRDRHPVFRQYIQSLVTAKMLEVCSTSLPQYSIPLVMGDPRYGDHLKARSRMFEMRSNEAYEIFSSVDGVLVNRTQGAFYMSVLFEPGLLNGRQKLPVPNGKARAYIEDIVKNVAPDKRFAYYLLGSAGICVVPLTGFCSTRHGFRITMLECDDEKRRWTWETISRSIQAYLGS